jgi:hypothetical protein
VVTLVKCPASQSLLEFLVLVDPKSPPPRIPVPCRREESKVKSGSVTDELANIRKQVRNQRMPIAAPFNNRKAVNAVTAKTIY